MPLRFILWALQHIFVPLVLYAKYRKNTKTGLKPVLR